MRYVIAYDVTSDRRRRKVLDRLRNYGYRVQYSVVECELDGARLQSLKNDVLPLLNRRTDRLAIYRQCETCYLRSDRFGSAEPL